jgi:[ribosomal protein S5]-alanine N-acetyltransferase
MKFALIRCGADGVPEQPIAAVPEAIAATYRANADLFRRVGYCVPWVSYIAVDSNRAVGGGAFVGPPRENCVEIAYFTLAELQGLGYATRTAAELIAIADQSRPGVVVRALTLQQFNASTKILQRLGFVVFGNAHDADAGDVWEWRRAPLSQSAVCAK